ncbi:hypothetical protein P4H94_05040 [Paenibacillus macerans]|uniref:hypothetical protein n=1 Tax=Paenibacillus macerans TaxID=44252 RepID=UPI001F0D7F7A|nr:hypothetical protein [Paenibacillus macerans]MEC0136248.1 hypothetical protein [Paenibacillus macerans]MEC0331886.1 hypothetical protein [Paenibacillus macerans]UMV49485.1 hypothetical protein LMZ02_09095 [Paenibacillus macerans]
MAYSPAIQSATSLALVVQIDVVFTLFFHLQPVGLKARFVRNLQTVTLTADHPDAKAVFLAVFVQASDQLSDRPFRQSELMCQLVHFYRDLTAGQKVDNLAFPHDAIPHMRY